MFDETTGSPVALLSTCGGEWPWCRPVCATLPAGAADMPCLHACTAWHAHMHTARMYALLAFKQQAHNAMACRCVCMYNAQAAGTHTCASHNQARMMLYRVAGNTPCQCAAHTRPHTKTTQDPLTSSKCQEHCSDTVVAQVSACRQQGYGLHTNNGRHTLSTDQGETACLTG